MVYNKWAEEEILPLYRLLKQKGLEFCYLNAVPNYPEFKHSIAHISFVNQYDITEFIKYYRNQNVPNILVVYPGTTFTSDDDVDYLPKENIFYVERYASLDECAQAIINKIKEFVPKPADKQETNNEPDYLADIEDLFR